VGKEIEFKVGDRVITPISERVGTITEICSRNNIYSNDLYTSYKVQLPLPYLKDCSFMNVFIECPSISLKHADKN
jgi:hypothetical protein